MAGLKVLLGLFPNTTDYEEKRIELQKEFDELLKYAESDELKQLKELEEFVSSENFKLKQKEILRQKYKGSDAYIKEKELQRLKKSKDIKLFEKTKLSEDLKLYEEIEASDKIQQLEELESFVKSEEYLKTKEHYKLSAKKRFELSDLGHTLSQYEDQKKSEEISGYFSFTGDKLFPNFERVNGSDKLKRYEELKSIVESQEFKSKKHSLSKDEFNASEEGKQFEEYTNLSSENDIKEYLKLESSHNKKYYDSLHGSDQLSAFEELDKFIHSHEFEEQKKAIMDKNFHDTDEYKKEHELEQLKKDPNLKIYFKFSKSKNLANYNRVKDSDKLKRLNELQAYVETDEFKDQKAYLTQKPKQRWEASDEYAKFDEYTRLKNSEKVKWFYANLNQKKFDWFRTWNISFSDEFNSGKLDTKKWLTKYYYGEEMLQNTYSLSEELHYISDGKNLDLSGNHLKIVTRKEKAEGIKWNPELGFFPSEFDYTSGLINTGKSFRQKYGLFEAKIKFSTASNLLNAFWMVGKQQTPHIDVASANGKCNVGIKTDKSKFIKSLSRAKFSGNYFIYSMEWNANKISWKINGLEIASTSRDIPQEEMYVVLSSGLYSEPTDSNIPAMEVDWIRCYEKAEAKK